MHKELKKKSERAERASELNRRASDPGERPIQASERSRRASDPGERAIPASERFRRASYSGERATIFTRASERELAFLNFYASERARARISKFSGERASELLALARSRSRSPKFCTLEVPAGSRNRRFYVKEKGTKSRYNLLLHD